MTTTNRKLSEELEVLAGWRGSAQQHALRKGDLANTQKLIASLRVTAQTLSKSLSVITNEINTVGGDVDDLKDRATTSEQKLASIESRIGTVSSQLDELESRILSANDSLEETDFNLSALQQEFDQLQVDYNQMIQSVTNVNVTPIVATSITGTPTDTQYNTLLSDVENVHQSITDLIAAITS